MKKKQLILLAVCVAVLLAGIGVALLIIALLPHRKADGRQ